ncbi:putative MFS transporter [Pleurostoma richardsiae]|uniref:MFS transporter n=1 Tax=Pleurostoma richardsiae TaxID=41990 RepID=A0AA38VN22_9PEZI|nr:putative MFS transporter [Pleurostoma richardsiae]
MAVNDLDEKSSSGAADDNPDAYSTPNSINHGEKFDSDASPERSRDVSAENAGEKPRYATGFGLWAIMSTIFLSTLLAALDIGIVSTAIPGITDDFHKLDDVGWYGSACFLLVGTSSPMWGKMYKYFSGRYVYLASIVLFLIGSLVAALAPNSRALITARAIQGWGCSGTLGGSVLMISYVAEPEKRPALIGMWMGIFMFSTIIGPLIGGAFTSEVTWRWCFWINLPVGGPVIVMLLLFLHIPKHIKPVPATWKEIALQLDFLGFVFLLASLVCVTLALQWGGQTKPWGAGSVVATLVVWALLTAALLVVEYFEGDRAMVPLRLLRPRLAWSNALFGWITNLANFQVLFYLPIYFQSIKGMSAIRSGVNNVPFMAFFAIGSVLSGGLIGATHFLQPFELVSGLLSTAGAALLYTLDVNSSKARYIGPQVIFGLGIGLGNQVPMTALQGLSSPEDVAPITGIMLMCNSISGAYFVTAAQSLFANRLLKKLAEIAPNIDAAKVLETGASDIKTVFTGNELTKVLSAYMAGIKAVFAFSLAGAALTVLISLMVPFTRLPNVPKPEATDIEAKDAKDAKDAKEAPPVSA